jgi:lysozyme
MKETLEQMIERHEGCCATAYDDATGKPLTQGLFLLGNLTIGVGHNLMKPLSRKVINLIRDEDINDARNECVHTFPWFADLTEDRQKALIDMCFNLGLPRLLGFKKFLKAMALGDYEMAAKELLDSDAGRKLKARYTELANMVRGTEEV